MRRVRIVTYQLPAEVEGETPQERKHCQVERVLAALNEAGHSAPDLVCLGEACTTGHLYADPTDRSIYEDAIEGPTIRQVRALARRYRMNVALPLEAYWRGSLRNLVVFIDREGALTGIYAKVHPTREERARGIMPGDEFSVFRLDFGAIGAVICHDISFVESARCLALQGAEVLIWPNRWSGWGEELCEVVIRSRAIDNGCWLVRVGYGYPHGQAWRPGMQLGRSGVIAPDGITLSSCGRGVGLSVAEVDLDAERIAHSFTWDDEGPFRWDLFADRRPDAYWPITDPARVPAARQRNLTKVRVSSQKRA
jgi:predicted amidohydrolase